MDVVRSATAVIASLGWCRGWWCVVAVAALVLFGTLVAVIGVVRPLIQWRRTGDTGVRMPSIARSRMQRWAHWGTGVGSVLVGVIAPIVELLGLPSVRVLDGTAVRTGGAVLAGVGVLATFAAQFALGRSWRIGVDADEKTALAAQGVFGVVRNPIFSAASVAFLGLALMVPDLVAVAGLVIVLIGTEAQVRRVEEPHLRHVYGAAYTEYAVRVGRFVPKVGRMQSRRE